MRRKLVFIAIIIFLEMKCYSQFDHNGNIFQKNYSQTNNLLYTSISIEIPKLEFKFDTLRNLTELNTEFKADAYPWISNDGLRLYYTKETQSADIIIMAERQHVDSLFTSQKELSINSSLNSNFAPWLTNNELNIFYIVRESKSSLTQLYFASRNNREDNFGKPTKIVLLGDFSGFLTSPSLTSNLEYLYIYNSPNNGKENKILIFKKSNNYEYTLNSKVKLPIDYNPGTGMLAQDDLNYYFSLKDGSEKSSLYVIKRKSIEDSFDSIFYLNNRLVNDSLFRNIQPTISNNGKYLVFTRNNDNSWSSNDLFIAYNKYPLTNINNVTGALNDVILFPNPANEYIIFKFHKLLNLTLSLKIYTIDGLLVGTYELCNNCSQINVPTGKFSSGNYIFEILSSDSLIRRGNFVIKK